VADLHSPAPRAAGPATTGRLPGAARLLAAQVRYQLLLLARNPRAMVLSLAFPLLILVLNSTARHDVGPQLETALVAGLATFGLIATAYVSHAIGLVTSRQDGVLRRWRATPLPAWCFFAGKITATALMALASVVIAVAGGITLFHAHVTAGTALSLLVTFTLGALAWAAIGTAVTALIPTAQSAGPVLMLTYIPVILFSGALGSQAGAPPWLSTVTSYLPARPIISGASQALRHSGGGIAFISGRDLAVLAAWAALGVVASFRFFRWDPARPQHPHTPAGAAV